MQPHSRRSSPRRTWPPPKDGAPRRWGGAGAPESYSSGSSGYYCCSVSLGVWVRQWGLEVSSLTNRGGEERRSSSAGCLGCASTREVGGAAGRWGGRCVWEERCWLQKDQWGVCDGVLVEKGETVVPVHAGHLG